MSLCTGLEISEAGSGLENVSLLFLTFLKKYLLEQLLGYGNMVILIIQKKKIINHPIPVL